MTNALFVSGGVKHIGSLRSIQLKRNGEIVTKLDLYDLLLKGDTRSDARLLPGDVIFIPPIGNTVGVSGEVHRPAIYELAGETSAKDIVALAGGLTAQADTSLATLERIDEQRRRITVNVDLTATTGQATPLRNSDVLRIPVIRPSLQQSVSLMGYVHRPGDYQYRPGMRLSDLVGSIDELKPNADQHYILIRREFEGDRRLAMFSADLLQALSARGTAADVELAPRDRVYVFDLESGRDSIIEPLMRDLRMQSTLDAPTNEVRVGGRVKVPGRYPLESGMRVSDLIRAGGSMDEAAYEGGAELTRYTVVNGESRQTELISIDLKKIRAGDLSNNLALQPFDYLVIKEVPLWKQLETVEVRGEVRFPGKYPIHRGESLRSVIERAGGLTESAFTEGAVFTRMELKERERKQLDMLANRMQTDIASLSLQAVQESGKDVSQALVVGQSMLTALKSSEPVGRLVIDLPRALKTTPGSTSDLILKDGDLLVIPRKSQEVTVLGEVQSATSHFYSPSIDRDEYISMSGGPTQRADKKRIYVVKADGSVMANSGNSWFSRSSTKMDAGDTIVVPLDAERVHALPLIQAVTSVVANLAIAAAALNSL
jgi:protein involved in polysaccharide export with SLBB domain